MNFKPLTRAQEQLLGPDAVRIREAMQRPFDETVRSGKAEYDGYRLSCLRAKAERLVIGPVLREYGDDGRGFDFAALGRFAVDQWHQGVKRFEHSALDLMIADWDRGLDGIGFSLALDAMDDPRALQRAFPKRMFDGRELADPRFCDWAFLHHAAVALAIHTACCGAIVCVAEDGIAGGGGIYSWVPPIDFEAFLPDAGFLTIPGEAERVTAHDYAHSVAEALGADVLKFIRTRDLLALRDGVSSGPRTGKQVSAERAMADCLSALSAALPERKARREDAIAAMRSGFLFSKAAAERVWGLADKRHWSVGGPLKPGEGIGEAELVELLTLQRKAKPSQ